MKAWINRINDGKQNKKLFKNKQITDSWNSNYRHLQKKKQTNKQTNKQKQIKVSL